MNTGTIIDYIDAPILNVVAGLNLLGFKTYMSCCGYNYKGEETCKIPKSHLKKAYVYLDEKQVLEDERLLALLSRICLRSNWQFKALNPYFIDLYGDTWSDKHPWSDRSSVHNYEVFLIVISAMEKSIMAESKLFNESAVIEDGNKYYHDNVSRFWEMPLQKSAIVKYNSESSCFHFTTKP